MTSFFRTSFVLCLSFFLFGCGNPYQVGDDFFHSIYEDNLKEAFNLTSPAFRRSTSFEGFQYMIQQYNLNKITQIEWKNAEIKPTGSQLKGTLHLSNETVIDMTLTLIDTADQLKILSITFSDPTLKNGAGLPSAEDTKSLIESTLFTFFDDVLTGDFESTYNQISNYWKKQITEEILTQSFQKFVLLPVEKKDFQYIRDTQYTLTESPQIMQTQDNLTILLLKGIYQTETQKTIFDLKYIYENQNWKLAGLQIASE